MALFGKNNFFSKPLGTGSNSVSANPLNINPLLGLTGIGNRIKDTIEKDPMAVIAPGLNPIRPLNTVFGAGGQSKDGSTKSLSKSDVENFIAQGEKKGELLTGQSIESVGKGRSGIIDKLNNILQGDSVGANRLRQSQSDTSRELKASQMLAGGGQMDKGQQLALKRQQDRDLSEFVSGEKRQALSDLSLEYRGAAGDISKMGGQYGSILIGASNPPPQVGGGSNGLLSGLFGGLF